MRMISFDKVKQAVVQATLRAQMQLRPDVLEALKKAFRAEKNNRAKRALSEIIENARIARKEKLAICQDTGLPIVFAKIGENVKVGGRGIEAAIQEGIESGYKKGYFRNSIIREPLRFKPQQSHFGPALIHYEIVKGSKLSITILPKGFGCENKSQLKMFLPTASLSEIKKFIVDSVKQAGADACPPYVVGVGIGGTADFAGLLAKKSLLKPLTHYALRTTYHAKLEKELLTSINKLNIGPMGLGGKTTALAVTILTAPTHIAGLPVAVNISCHALRSATIKI